MKHLFAISAVAIATLATSCAPRQLPAASYDIIPQPQNVALKSESGFRLSDHTLITYPAGNDTLRRNAVMLAEFLKPALGTLRVSEATAARGGIHLQSNLKASNPEAYTINVSRDGVVIDGATAAGNFYGIQSLRKSIPADLKGGKVILPAGVITDAPRFAYRGAHLDVARHYFPLDSVKRFVDLIAMHNVNRLHWHITDDQGWRIEISKYPRLTEVGAKRSGTCIGHDMDTSDSIPYGGYYTQDEARELIRYAAERHITVIPEVDLPGHMLGALAAYPHMGCTGGPYEVWRRWGVSDDILCAGNDSTYTFIADVLNEIADIFPSEYIHIGGDEAPKVRWQSCPKCQAKIQELGYTSDSHSTKEQKLQTHIMSFASDVLAKRGRKIIGWEEMMEGGLPEGATVMSWLGVEGGLKAAKMGHDAIMTPMQYCYFDYCQTLDRKHEPDCAGGFLPLHRVYSFNPVPESFSPEEAAHIVGVQPNLWTEYIPTFSQAMYMELPRLAAISEVQWCDPKQKDFDRFAARLPKLIKHYDALGYNHSNHIYSKTYTDSIAPCLSTGCEVTLLTQPDIRYSAPTTELTNGYTGPMVFNTGAWFGFNGTPMEAVVDLKHKTEINQVSVHTLYDTGNWIFPPTTLTVLVSDDGINFRQIASEEYVMPTTYCSALEDKTVTLPTTSARFVKVILGCVTAMPEWHGGKGLPAYIFVDEISVR